MKKYGVKVRLAAKVGSRSLCGTYGEYPRKGGNYFSFRNNARCLNMWAENLEEAAKRFLPDGLIEGWLFIEERKTFDKKWFVVDDDRIPKTWLLENLYWTGASSPNNIEITREMYSIHGDTDNEIEQFTDPKRYHEKRGNEYIERPDGMALIKTSIKANPKKLLELGDWTIETAKDIVSLHGIDVEDEIQKALLVDATDIAQFEKPLIYTTVEPPQPSRKDMMRHIREERGCGWGEASKILQKNAALTTLLESINAIKSVDDLKPILKTIIKELYNV